MRKMKRIVAIVLLIVIACSLTGCKRKTADDIWDNIEAGADPEAVERMRNGMREAEAEMNGDTYCKDCEKFIEGKVRICPYCGQYI